MNKCNNRVDDMCYIALIDFFVCLQSDALNVIFLFLRCKNTIWFRYVCTDRSLWGIEYFNSPI